MGAVFMTLSIQEMESILMEYVRPLGESVEIKHRSGKLGPFIADFVDMNANSDIFECPAAALKISAHACHATNIQLYGEPARGWSYDVFPANVKLTDVDGKILRSSEFDDSDSFKAALLDVIPLKNR
jgi:hypothetical protein